MDIKKLLIIGILCLMAFSCVSPDTRRARVIINPGLYGGGQISHETLKQAWQEALQVFGGDPKWILPVTPERVIFVPAPLPVENNRYFGITIRRPEFINQQVVLVETIEIHLAPKESCRVYHVLVHEMGHLILLRRALTDPTFYKLMQHFPDEESILRSMWPPPEEMNGPFFVCP